MARRVLLRLSDTQVIAAETGEFNGEDTLSVRKFVKKRDGTWARTKNGLTLDAGTFAQVLDPLLRFARSVGAGESEHERPARRRVRR